MILWNEIANEIGRATARPFRPAHTPQNVGGGCINTAVKLSDPERSFFIKLNRAALLYMFEAEAAGLRLLAGTKTLRVPMPICSGIADGQAYLVLETIEMGGHGGRKGVELAGRQLAAMHRVRWRQFGWDRDNTIGSTHQPNTPSDNWVSFWREQRLGFQLDLAARNGYGGLLQRQGGKLLECFPALIDHDPIPSLLHGDLWGGNIAYDRDDSPVIFDPAVYYGDREADLAMTELFGGFGDRFYAAYQEVWPTDSGYAVRKNLYNLYHILNHANMFGGGYLGQASRMMDRLLAEV